MPNIRNIFRTAQAFLSIMDMDIIVIDYKTVEYRGLRVVVGAELIQDVHAGSQPPSVLEKIVLREYERALPEIRDRKLAEIGI